LYNGVKTSEIKMSKKNQLEKLCPECEEEMNPVYDKTRYLPVGNAPSAVQSFQQPKKPNKKSLNTTF